MFKNVLKGVLFLATTAVAVPYTTALICNLLYGWPSSKSKFKRAFTPSKVYNLNYSVLQKLYISLRYIPLYVQWKKFYRSLDPFHCRKNIAYGRNQQTLDLYLPKGLETPNNAPVVVFIYGGAWGSGNKKMYGMLCSQLADKIGAVVCCPNHSTYPQGYVDDMIQDVVDCVMWINCNIVHYGGNKDKVLLIGHSSGAHLCMMALLELLHEELLQISGPQAEFTFQESLRFQERHFNGSGSTAEKRSRTDVLDDSSGSSGSFCVLNENDRGPSLESTNTASGFEVLGKSVVEVLEEDQKEEEGEKKMEESVEKEQKTEEVEKSEKEQSEKIEGKEESKKEEEKESLEVSEAAKKGDKKEEIPKEPTAMVELGQGDQASASAAEGQDEAHVAEEDKPLYERDSSVIVISRQEVPHKEGAERRESLNRTPTLVDVGKTIKAVIGLAGVYHIGDHYEHETTRGVEDVSSMARAMYGEDHFDRFSPTFLIQRLPTSASLPSIVLLHGTEDYVVPVTSTTKLADAISDIMGDVMVRIIPGCDHYDICLDLMKPSRMFHETVLGLILETASKVLR